MINDRPVENPRLQKAMDEVRQTLARYGFAGAVCIVSADEMVFSYKMHAPWSSIDYDPTTEMGFRIRANSRRDGKELTQAAVEGAVHTICQMSDFGEQTMSWMEDLKLLLRQHGIDFDHNPFGGKPLHRLKVRGE